MSTRTIIIILIVAYLFIGAIIAGFDSETSNYPRSYYDTPFGYILTTIGWGPAIVVSILLIPFHVLVDLGKRLGKRFDK